MDPVAEGREKVAHYPIVAIQARLSNNTPS
jgi:hypothetical protein